MKRLLLKVLAVILLATATFAPSAAQQPAPKRTEQPKEQTVYVTPHRQEIPS
jgi:hypothetical protein